MVLFSITTLYVKDVILHFNLFDAGFCLAAAMFLLGSVNVEVSKTKATP